MTATFPAALAGRRLVVVDVEGNGQQPPEIIEIAMLAVDDDAPATADLRSWLVRPHTPINPIVTHKVHGIADHDVAAAPAWDEVAGEIEALLSDRVLVAHHAHVEHTVLTSHLPGWQPTMVLDTLRLAKRVWPGLSSYSLDKLAVHADLDLGGVANGHHRADHDTWAAWQLLLTLAKDGDLDWSAVVDLAALPGLGRPPEPEGRLW